MRTVGLTLAFLGMTCACAVAEYSVVLRNASSHNIDDAHVMYGRFQSVGGVIPPGAFKEHSGIQTNSRPIPERATVQWRTEDGVLHSKSVEVRSVVPSHFSGEINFDIGEAEQVRVWVKP